MMQQSPPMIPAETVLTLQLQAQQWNIVFAGLDELPHKVARPIWGALMEQVQQQMPQGEPVVGNGLDHQPPQIFPPEVVPPPHPE